MNDNSSGFEYNGNYYPNDWEYMHDLNSRYEFKDDYYPGHESFITLDYFQICSIFLFLGLVFYLFILFIKHLKNKKNKK